MPHRCIRVPWRPLGVLGVLTAVVAAAPAQAPPEPRRWSSAVLDALAAYHDGRHEEAEALCRSLYMSDPSPAVRQDAAVLQALCLLQMPARGDRLAGRGRLAQLAEEEPGLRNDPECNLAYGRAQTALRETASALDALHRAVTTFAAQRETGRQLAALLALAEAWAAHGEWELTSEQLGVPRGLQGPEREALRRERIEAARAQAAGLPGAGPTAAQIDLVLARCLLKHADTAEAGWKLLASLADGEPLSSTSVEAALLLAEHHEQSGHRAEAARLYERVSREWQGQQAQQAEDRLRSLVQPQLRVEAPATVHAGQAAALRIQARGLAQARLEVRLVDLSAWLAPPQRRGLDAHLPESGSVCLTRELDVHAAGADGWWDSQVTGAPLELTAPPGAYAVIARGREADGREHVVKRLLVVSDLEAVCVLGRAHALVWVTGAQAGTDAPRVSFWMRHSFAPVQAQAPGGVARFALPPEVRVMRDRNWVCLVQAGEQAAVCRGVWQPPPSGRDAARVALVGGPAGPHCGESLYVAGLVVPQPGDPHGDLPRSVELRLADSLGQLEIAGTAAVSSGAFAAEMPIQPSLRGQQASLTARSAGQVLENVGPRVQVRVPRRAEARYPLRFELPPACDEDTATISGALCMDYPWGQRPWAGWVHGHVRAIPLAAAPVEAPTRPQPDVTLEGVLDPAGRLAVAAPAAPEAYGLTGRPGLAVLNAGVRTWDGTRAQTYGEVLLGPEQAYVWLWPEPAKARVGDAVRFRAGWYAPDGLASYDPLAVEVSRGADSIARLELRASSTGPETGAWTPREPGAYEARLSLATDPPVVAQSSFTVGSRPADNAGPVGLECRAHFTHEAGRPGVQINAVGQSAMPWLALIEADDPLAAAAFDQLAGRTEAFVPLGQEPTAGQRLIVIGLGASGPEALAAADVEADPTKETKIELVPSRANIWPGTTVSIGVTSTGEVPAGTTLLLRLIPAAQTGLLAGPAPPEALPQAPSILQCTTTGCADRALGRLVNPPATRGLGDRLTSRLMEGETLWCTACEACGAGEEPAAGGRHTRSFDVPLPAAPGLYRLVAIARRPDGGTATATALLDARHGVSIWADAPEKLTLGDRASVALLLENGGPAPTEVTVQIDTDNRLEIEGLRPGPWADSSGSAVSAGNRLSMPLPARGRAWIYVDTEAARAGTGQGRIVVRGDGATRTVPWTYEVFPADEPTQATWAFPVRRTLWVWTPTGAARPSESAGRPTLPASRDPLSELWFETPGPLPRLTWDVQPWSPGQRVRVGQMVQVREEVVLDRTRRSCLWRQRLPDALQVVGDDVQPGRPLGGALSDPRDALQFRVPDLPEGTHVNEYYLAAVRPGAYVLPVPELMMDDARIPVAVEPTELRLVIVGGP